MLRRVPPRLALRAARQWQQQPSSAAAAPAIDTLSWCVLVNGCKGWSCIPTHDTAHYLPLSPLFLNRRRTAAWAASPVRANSQDSAASATQAAQQSAGGGPGFATFAAGAVLGSLATYFGLHATGTGEGREGNSSSSSSGRWQWPPQQNASKGGQQQHEADKGTWADVLEERLTNAVMAVGQTFMQSVRLWVVLGGWIGRGWALSGVGPQQRNPI